MHSLEALPCAPVQAQEEIFYQDTHCAARYKSKCACNYVRSPQSRRCSNTACAAPLLPPQPSSTKGRRGKKREGGTLVAGSPPAIPRSPPPSPLLLSSPLPPSNRRLRRLFPFGRPSSATSAAAPWFVIRRAFPPSPIAAAKRGKGDLCPPVVVAASFLPPTKATL